MPEKRGFPKFLPRLGADVVIIFGAPITDRIRPLLEAYRDLCDQFSIQRPVPPQYEGEPQALMEARVKIADLLREEVERLGREYNEGKRPAVVGGGHTDVP
jgi:monolysocardiolipin acyltransferase